MRVQTKKIFSRILVCAVICGMLSACSATAEHSYGNDEAVTEKVIGQENSEAAAASEEPKSTPGIKPETAAATTVQPDLDGRYGYIADADGNIIEYVPETVISENSYQAVNSMDLTDTETILDSLNEALSIEASLYYETKDLSNGVQAEVSENCVQIFAEAAEGAEVVSLAAGTVTSAGFAAVWGYSVCVEDADGQVIRYAHLSEIKVEKGDTVDKNQVIGLTGTTGRTFKSGVAYVLEKKC